MRGIPGLAPSQALSVSQEDQNSAGASGTGDHDPEKEADFGKAYSKLVKKFYYQQEQGANILIPEEDLMRVEEEEHYSGAS